MSRKSSKLQKEEQEDQGTITTQGLLVEIQNKPFGILWK